MNEFNDILQHLSEESSPPPNAPLKNDLQFYSNYREVNQSEMSAHDKRSHTVIQPSIEQSQEVSPKYNLLLPASQHQRKQAERNTQSKSKQIIKTAKDVRETKLKIINLQDDIEEDVIERSVKQEPEEVVEESVVNYRPIVPLIIQEQNNSFLQLQQIPKIKINPLPLIPQRKAEKVDKAKKEEQMKNAKSNVLFTRSKIVLKQPQVPKDRIYDSEDKEQYGLGLKSQSKNSLDSGLNVTSVMSSRDELSTRNIINYPQRKRYVLPQLKPYKQISNQQIITVPSHQYLRDDIQSQSTIVQKPLLISSQEITNVTEFVKQPIEAGRRLQCSLIRNKSCLKRFHLDYDLQTNDGKFLMSCKKMAFCLNSNYHISLANGTYDQKSELFLGKVQGNFTGSIFNVFTYDVNSFQQKQMVATIFYNSTCSWCRQSCREFELYVKNDNYKYYQLQGTELQKGRNLKDLYGVESNKTLKMINKYINKPPRWNQKQQAYVVNFRGKCKQGSVKNTVIISEDRPDQQLLLLAKQDSNKFAFDISHPFSPLIAFALIITGFDYKMASQ